MTSLHDGNDAVPGTHPGPSLDLLIAGGTMVDGSGGPPRRADVGIAGDRIVAVGDLPRSAASRVLDVPGLVVAPGFVDSHGHSDVAVLSSPRVPSKIRQGTRNSFSLFSPNPARIYLGVVSRRRLSRQAITRRTAMRTT